MSSEGENGKISGYFIMDKGKLLVNNEDDDEITFH